METNGTTKHGSLSRIPIAYLILGWENNHQAIVDFLRNAKSLVNVVTDAIQESISSKRDWLWKEISDARRRGITFRTITDIMKENFPDCKKNMVRIDELRHLAGIGFVFGVSDVDFVAMVPSSAPREETSKIQFIHSDSESVVEYKQLVFAALLKRAIPAQSRINDLEREDLIQVQKY
jgi:hypothetical protein